MAASMAWVSKGLRFFSPDRSRRLVFGSMRFSTAASGTSLTRTQIFKTKLLRSKLRGFSPRRPACVYAGGAGRHSTRLTDESVAQCCRFCDRGHRGTQRVISAVHVEDLAADAAGPVREEEARRLGDRGGIFAVPAERCAAPPERREFLESRDSTRGDRLERARGDEVHAHASGAEVAREVAGDRL